TAIDEIVAFDASEGECVVVLGEAAHPLGVWEQRQGLALPCAPGARRFDLYRRVSVGEAAVEGGDHVAALLWWNYARVVFEGVGKDPARSFLVEPFKLSAAKREDASEHELGHPFRVGLGVSERQRRAPRATEHLPSLHAKMDA